MGDPEVGEVLYKGNLQHVSRLPFASEEAEMVGDLLDIQPLLGKKATKETILQSIHSVSLIHFAAHGDAERGEIVLLRENGLSDVEQWAPFMLVGDNVTLDFQKLR